MRHVPLLTAEEVPPDAREVAILRGYRPTHSTTFQCIASIFNATNETLNFWTHFIPTWYFVYQLYQLILILKFDSDPYTWAFVSCMFTCCVYPLMSCTAHAFSSLSDKARHICYFLDYAALSLYSYGVAVLYRAYSFPDSFLASGFADSYLAGSLFLSAMGTVMACTSRFVSSLIMVKVLRLGAYALPYIWESMPLMYRLYECQTMQASNHELCLTPALGHHARQFIVASTGAFVYASHMPERLAPGKFDIVGHSHQLLHICSVMATYEQMYAALQDMSHRRNTILSNGWMLNYFWSWLSVPALLLFDSIVVVCFIAYLIRKYKTEAVKMKEIKD